MVARVAEAQRLYREDGYSPDKPLSFELRYNSGEVHTKLAVRDRLHVEGGPGGRGAPDAGGVSKSLLQDIDRGEVEMSLELGSDYNDASPSRST